MYETQLYFIRSAMQGDAQRAFDAGIEATYSGQLHIAEERLVECLEMRLEAFKNRFTNM